MFDDDFELENSVVDETLKTIELTFDRMAYMAYMYYYFNPKEAEKDEKTKSVYESARRGALRMISKKYETSDESLCVRLLEKCCNKELTYALNNRFKNIDSYKEFADSFFKCMLEIMPTPKRKGT